ncbi:LytR/AlgR family response regulator transcription factor [Limosilactobacillus reuteri]|uniref:LytR/AlgR family response regulator transcription factor n=1 Tax=Limosilactobacillus reuteri TaxID=1598 RepID=UPI001C5AD282|nr:LytTR family DNA-binding domain-containing protein [Limosilactobacillus reuteri]MBW3351334.1 LytTR family DNA-binding domain-containing protein [Limosilactobacillus reuteri]UUW69726.1 LytTR family DNA-binding domain-containing protein [Limosilactobacillus reuteri]
MMLNIIILEDEVQQREHIVDFINRYSNFESLDVSVILATDDPNKILNLVYSNKNRQYMFILDIELTNNDITGIKLAEKLRLILPFTDIIFLTSHEELSMLTLERRISPLNYILKNKGLRTIEASIRRDIRFVLNKITKINETTSSKFTYKIRNRYYTIPLENIYFFESVPHKVNRVIMHAKNRIIEINSNLKKIEEEQSVFFRCHKSYSIQVNNVKYYDPKLFKVYFDEDGQIFCPVSVRKVKQLKITLEYNKS